MGTGYLTIQTRTGDDTLPIVGANVIIRDENGNILYDLITDVAGNTGEVSLAAPPKGLSLDPSYTGEPYETYDVTVIADGFMPIIINDVQVFDTISSVLPVAMIPQIGEGGGGPYVREIDIPPNSMLDPAPTRQLGPTPTQQIILREVTIPSTIVVHLGNPDSNAQNVRVDFIDYIKNVASSEVFPDWPDDALEANIYAQISFTLNRIYTEWYRSRGYNFDITNRTQYDQAYVDGRDIFTNISRIVDRIFNQYIRRIGYQEPLFAQYCDGRSTQCDGLTQWGTLSYAQQGLAPLDILKRFYGDDIEISQTDNIVSSAESYPNVVLREGSAGEDVQILQRWLNRIRTNFPNIPLITNPNGYFGADTTSAVRTFQQNQKLSVDGIVGRSTWYEISRVYAAVRNLASLKSEGERIGIGTNPPSTVLRVGSTGPSVIELQFILNVLSAFYPVIPYVTEDGGFGTQTGDSVMAFQKLFDLTPDGIVGPGTWNKLYSVFRYIEESVDIPPETIPPVQPPAGGPQYPGSLLKVGSQGSNVTLMQQYLNKIRASYPSIPLIAEDGIFGSKTREAVVAFQRLFGLTPDGIIGSDTWKSIVDVSNRNAPTISIQYPNSLLQVGSRGSNVLLMQQYLNTIGTIHSSIPRLTADGIFGNKTKSAVIAFQKLFGLSQDGIIGPNTWSAIVNEYNKTRSQTNRQFQVDINDIFSGELLKIGSENDDVLLMQQYLNTIGIVYPSIPKLIEDGIFGANTEKAVIAFQNQFGLVPDGIIGNNTWDAIVKEYDRIILNYTSELENLEPSEISELQKYLNRLSNVYYSVPRLDESGVYDNNTKSAIEAFQKLEGLNPTGIMNEITRNAIIREYKNINL